MAIEDVEITGVEPAPMAPPAQAQEGAPGAPGNPPKIFEALPDEVADIQVVQWVSAGKPPAVRVGPGEYYPELEPIEKNLTETVDAGLDIYRASSGDLVLYNPLFLDSEELKLADAEGKLDMVAPLYSELTGKTPEPIDEETANRLEGYAKRNVKELAARGVTAPQDGAAEGTATPVSRLPAEAQTSLVRAQVDKGQMNSPTSGPRPGGGRILNSILAQ